MANLLEEFDLKPIGNFVVLRRQESKEMTEGGIHLPYQAQEKSLLATVVSAGPGVIVAGGTFIETTVNAGDIVLVDQIGGFEMDDGSGGKLLVVREPEIIAVVVPKE